MERNAPVDNDAPLVNSGNAEFRFALRPAMEADWAFIVDSWRRSHEDCEFTRCPGGLAEYVRTQRQVIETCLASSDVVVAHPEAPDCVPDQILGWACYRLPAVLHYVFVKQAFRDLGIARALAQHAVGWTTGEGGWPGTAYVTHHWRRPMGKGDAAMGLVQAAHRREVRVEYNPALIFGGAKP